MNKVHGLLLLILLPISIHTNAGTFPSHNGRSPWTFEVFNEPSSKYVVNDTDGNNDRFLFGNQGPIELQLSIRRYVGPTDGDGKLQNLSDLISRGIISDKFTLRLPAFDVDENTNPVFDCDGDDIDDTLFPEVDTVFFNDEEIGVFRGANQVWQAQSFTLDIDKLKFPSAPGQVAINTVNVEIDTKNKDVVLSSGAVGCIVWATEVDWASVEFKASDPVVLVHGINSSGAAFVNFQRGLEDRNVVFDASINLTDPAAPDPIPPGCPANAYNLNTANHVTQLRAEMERIAQQYGVESINIAAHSKGGIDSRAFLDGTIASPLEVTVGRMGGQDVKQDLEANSIVTLNTPYRGSVLADYGVAARQLTGFQAAMAGLNTTAASLFEGSYYCDLTTAIATAAVTSTNLPSGTQSGSVATDADTSGNAEIDGNEADGFTGGRIVANRLYQLIGNTAAVAITITPRRFLPDTITVTETPTGNFQLNDVVVPVNSSNEYTIYNIDDWHHLNVHSEMNGRAIATDSQGSGIVDWRAK